MERSDKLKNHKKRRSAMPYKVSTMKIGDLIQAQARAGNPQAKASAKKFIELYGGAFDERADDVCCC